MFTLALISQKGNVGKTTMAFSLAVAAAKAGQVAVILDVDPQATATKWEDRRKRDNPVVVPVPVSLLDRELAKAREAGADLVIIDCPGMNQSSAIDAARVADLVLIPPAADSIVMETLPTVRNLIRAANDPPAFVVYNFIHPSGSRIADALKANTLDFCGLPACPAHLTRRNTYSDAPTYGQAPQEAEPDGAAAAEIERLYLFISEHVHMSKKEHNGERGKKA